MTTARDSSPQRRTGSLPARQRATPTSAAIALTFIGTAGFALVCIAPRAVAQAPSTPRTLSNERTLSRWANPEERAVVRRAPDAASRAVGRLHLDTEDDRPEVYLALQTARDATGASWVRVRLPSRPNGRTGWVPRDALGTLHRNTLRLVIDRRALRATLTDRGRRVWSARVGVGRASTPTPVGRFYVRERLVPPRGTIYGAVAYGTSAYADVSDWPGGGVVGIHGTDQPQLIPGRPSHGCVRIRASDLRRLDARLKIGTPILIR